MIDINKTKEILCNRLDAAFSEVIKVEDQIGSSQDKLSTLKKDIKKQEKVIVQLDILEEQIDKLIGVRAVLKEEIKENNKQYKDNIKDSAQQIKEQDAQLKQLNQDLSLLQAKHKQELNKILPKIEDLTKREQLVKQKEQDISVIERRYKKLFKVYGANFKL